MNADPTDRSLVTGREGAVATLTAEAEVIERSCRLKEAEPLDIFKNDGTFCGIFLNHKSKT